MLYSDTSTGGDDIDVTGLTKRWYRRRGPVMGNMSVLDVESHNNGHKDHALLTPPTISHSNR